MYCLYIAGRVPLCIAAAILPRLLLYASARRQLLRRRLRAAARSGRGASDARLRITCYRRRRRRLFSLLVPPSASERLVGFTETRERIARKRPAAGEAPIDLTVSDDEAGGEQQQGERVPLADAFAVAAGTSSVPIPVD